MCLLQGQPRQTTHGRNHGRSKERKKTERERHKETKRGRKATKLDHNYKLDIRDTIKQKRHIWLHSITGKDKTLKMRKIQ